MPLPADTDVSSPKYLRDKYAIVGVGETTYTRGSGMTTRALGTWAVKNAILDAGLTAADVDGMLSYQSGDSTSGRSEAGHFPPYLAACPDSRMIFSQRVCSPRTYAVYSCGDWLKTASAATAFRRCMIWSCFIALVTALCSFNTTDRGSPAGPNTPFHWPMMISG